MKLLKPNWVTHGSASKKTPFPRPIYTLDIHPDGKRLATGGLTDGGGLIILWDMAIIRKPDLESSICPTKLFQMDNHQACVNCVRWSPSGRWLASGGMDRVIMLWVKTAAGIRASSVFGATEKMKFTEHWRCATVLRHHSGDIIDLAWAQDGTRLASASVDNSVVIWGVVTNGTPGQPFQCVTVLKGHGGPVKGVTWDPAGRYLATQADGVGVRVWRVADWQEETRIAKPFNKTADQSEITRLSWSPDGSLIVAPHATNNKFPTAQLIHRSTWKPGLDLVGHEKHVVCARYNPALLRRKISNGSSAMICLALGSKDRSISVWTTMERRAFVVIRDLFTSSVSDLTWSSDGRELLASSLDGSVSYICFTTQEIGEPLKNSEVARLHRTSYGQSLLDHPLNSNGNTGSGVFGLSEGGKSGATADIAIVLETPEALALQRSQAELREKLSVTINSSDTSSNTSSQSVKPIKPSNQVEARTKDGRRRITPCFLGSLDCMDEEPPNCIASNLSRVEESENESSKNTSVVCLDTAKPLSSPPPLLSPSSTTAINEKQSNLDSRLARKANSSTDALEKSSNSIKTATATVPVAESIGNGVAIPMDTSPLPVQKKRTRIVELTAAVPDTDSSTSAVEEHIKEKKSKKRKRNRLFEEEVAENTSDYPQSSSTPAAGKQASKSGDKEILNTSTSGQKALAADIHRRPHGLSIGCLDQIAATKGRTQFVCCNPIEGAIIVNVANAAATVPSDASKHTSSQHKVSALRGDKTIWSLQSRDRFTAHAHTTTWMALGDIRGRLRLLWSTGSPICPPLILDSSVLLLASFNPNSDSGGLLLSSSVPCGDSSALPSTLSSSSAFNVSRLSAITATGHLLVWNVPEVMNEMSRFTIGRIASALPQVVSESTLAGIVQSGKKGACASLEFSSLGFPVVRLVCGSCYLFNTDLKIWIELFDGMNVTKCHAAVTMHRTCPSGPLESVQQFSKIATPETGALSSDPNRMSLTQRQNLLEFLDSQVQGAELLGSSAEFKFWLLRWFKQLIEDGYDERVRQICMDFIGPFDAHSQSTWDPLIKGLSKRSLAKDLLALFALNLRMQRLYMEMKELLEQAQET